MSDLQRDFSPVVVIGAGAAGTVLARALGDTGVRIDRVISRSLASAQRLAEAVGVDVFSDRLKDVGESPGLLILSVPDDEIPDVARKLARLKVDWTACTAMHLSGVLSSAVLAPLHDRGVETLSFHPMIALRTGSPLDVLKGAWINVEGGQVAVNTGQSIADELGARGRVVTARDKAVIHVAASIASNYVVALLAIAVDLLESTGISEDDYDHLLRPLIEATINNVDVRDPAAALTGPISRGDRETLRTHLDVLRGLAPELIPVVAGLAAETVRLALRNDRILEVEASDLLNLLEEAVDSAGSRA